MSVGGKSVATFRRHYKLFDENEEFDKRHNPLSLL
jgi:hypothetical protein